MMTCDEGAEALHDLLFSELDDATHARLNEHLLGCEACRTLERRLIELRDGIRGTPGEPGDALRERIRTAHARALPGRVPLWRRPVPAYAALAGMALCVALAGVLARSRPAAEPAARDARDAVVEAPTVALPGGGLAFNPAQAYDTHVRGAVDAAERVRERTSRRDTL
jgi:anti-sigma factor RsiW